MDRAEYDRLHRSKPLKDDAQADPTESRSITVDGSTVAPLRIKYKFSTPQERCDRRHARLAEHERVVGYTDTGVPLVRRTGGADYAGADAWRGLMRRCGRLRR